MPRAPRYDGMQIGSARPVEARFRPANNNGGVAGAIGGGLERLGDAGARYAQAQDQLNAQHDDTQARELATNASLTLTTVADEYTTLKAGAAREAQEEYRKRLDDARNEALEQASNPRMRRMLEDRIAAHYQRGVLAIGKHAVAEQMAEREVVFAGQEAGEIRLAASTEDPALADAYTARAVAVRFEKIEELNGLDRDNPDHQPIFEAERLAVTSQVHGSRIDLMNADPETGVDDIVGYVEAYGDEMTLELKAATLSRLKDPLQSRSSRSIVDAVMGLATEEAAAVPMGDGEETIIATPVDGSVPRGGRFTDSRDGGRRQHRALDISAPIGTPIYTVAPGKVTAVKPLDGASGNWVQVTHTDGTTSTYSHMNSFSVKVGDTVGAGAVLGEVGNTGVGTAPHLHLVMRDKDGNRVDPEQMLGKTRRYTPQPQEHDRASLYRRLDEYARENNLDPEETERARLELDRRIERDEGLKREVESDALDAATEIVFQKGAGFTSTNSIPRATWDNLSANDKIRLEEIAERNRKPKPVEANSPAYLELRLARAQGRLGEIDLVDYIGKVTDAEFGTMAEAQAKQAAGGTTTEWSPRSKITGMISFGQKLHGLELSDEEWVSVYEIMEGRARALHAEKNGKLSDDDYRAIFEYAVGEKKMQGGGFFGLGGPDTMRRYEIEAGNISADKRTRIVTALQRIHGGDYEPTDEEIVRYWRRHLSN